jgi:uncharacterized cupin superfamily protein
MALRHVRIDQVAPSEGDAAGLARVRIADIGRALGSLNIGLAIQTVSPGGRSSRRHRHVFQEEILLVMAGTGVLVHGDQRVPASPGDAFCYRPDDPEPHCFENTATTELVIWAFGNRLAHEVCLYPDEGVAFVESLGADVKLAEAAPGEPTASPTLRSGRT